MFRNILSTFIFISVSSMLLAGNPVDTSKIQFRGKELKIKYTVNREIEEVPFSLKNNSGKKITVKLYGAFLVRGKSYEALERAKMSMYYRNKMRKLKELEVPPGREVNFVLSFKPFTIYTGSTYTVLCSIYVDGVKMEASCPINMFKLEQVDKNKYKKKEE